MKHDNVSVTDIVSTIIDNMRYSHAITSFATVTAGSVYRVNTVNTHDILADKYVTIGSTSYKVLSVTANSFFTISATATPSGAIWKADYPYFYYGSPVQVEENRKTDKNVNKLKFPFISLFTPIKSDLNILSDNPIAEEASLWMIFMDDKSTKRSLDDIEDDCIKQMRALLYRFISQCEVEHSLVQFDDTYEDKIKKTEYSDYGLIAKMQGYKELIIMERLAGVEIEDFKLPILKLYSC